MRIFRKDEAPAGAGDVDEKALVPASTEAEEEAPSTTEDTVVPLSMKAVGSVMDNRPDLSLMISGAPIEHQPDIDLVALSKKLEQRRHVQEMAVSFTLKQDWMYEKGKPYLTAPGAERIMMGFGVTIRDFWISPKILFEDEYGPGYRYEASLIVWHPQIGWMPGLAVCSTRHDLWKRKRPEGGYRYLPPSAIPETEVKHTVISWSIRDGISRQFGLRNLTKADLERLGKDKAGAMGEVKHDGKEKAGDTEGKPPATSPAGGERKRQPGDEEVAGKPGEQRATGAVGPGGEVDMRG